jgi:hypothetical protein
LIAVEFVAAWRNETQARRRFRIETGAPVRLRCIQFEVERIIGLGGLRRCNGLREQRWTDALRRRGGSENGDSRQCQKPNKAKHGATMPCRLRPLNGG